MKPNEKLEGEFIIGEKKSQESSPIKNIIQMEPNRSATVQDKADHPLQSTTTTPTVTPDKPTHMHGNKQSHDVTNVASLPKKVPNHIRPHFFSSFVYYPEGISFENQEHDEELILLIRRDFITNLPWILLTILLAIAPPLLLPFLPMIVPFVTFTEMMIVLGTIFYYTVLTGFVITQFSLWYYHVGLVTNKRITDVDVHGILIRDVSRALVEDIEDVSYSQVGVIPSIFNYGDVRIQTAGEKVNFEFDRVPEPSLIIQIIQDLMAERRNGHEPD